MSSFDPMHGSNPDAGVPAVSGPGAPPPGDSHTGLGDSHTGLGGSHPGSPSGSTFGGASDGDAAADVAKAARAPETVGAPPAGSPPEGAAPIYDPFWREPPRSERSLRRDRRRQRLTLVVAVSALLTALGTVGAIAWGAVHWRHLIAGGETSSSTDEETTKRAGLPTAPSAEPDEDEPERADVRRDTETQLRGAIEVVDVGLASSSLEEVLAFHYQVAESKGQRLLVMTTGRRCGPCHGVDDALSHPLMQKALGNVRLVRVDLDVFGDELEGLHMPRNLYPAFFLIGEDVRPIDAIHGGEWDEDIAENIAPVLGAFVKGEYKQRRYPDWSPTTTSIPL